MPLEKALLHLIQIILDKWETVVGEVLYLSFEKTGDYT